MDICVSLLFTMVYPPSIVLETQSEFDKIISEENENELLCSLEIRCERQVL